MEIKYLFSPKQKEQADKDLAIYKRGRELELDREIESRRIRGQQEVDQMILQAKQDLVTTLTENAKSMGASEHEYHYKKQKDDTALAKVEALLETKSELLAEVNSIPELKARASKAEAESAGKEVAIDHLKQDVTRLDELVKFMAGLIPKFELDKVGFTLNADVKVEQGKGGGEKKENKGGEQK